MLLSPVSPDPTTPAVSSPGGDQTDEAVGAAPERTITQLLELVPEQWRSAVARNLGVAGINAETWLDALHAVPAEQREGLAFLIAYMPQRDLRELSADYVLENVALAYRVRHEVPWGRDIPMELFLNDVLPYASLNERRDRWRADFHERFLASAREAGTIEDAVLALNKQVFQTLNVRYHATKRPKPDQSPFESIEAGFASCTGLSIMLTDALRAVGVPARIAGTPMWVDQSGNHTWVEVWTGDDWHHVGAAEPGPLDRTWFNGKASKADGSRPEHRIYASSWADTGVLFPLVWDPSVEYVHAVNVTARYTAGADDR